MDLGQYQGGMDTQGYYTGGPPPDVYAQDGRGYYADGGAPLQSPDGASNADDGTKSYMKYTEKGGQGQIDDECGIAPRRLTDCVCLFVFLAYVLGMVILVTYAKNEMIHNRQWGEIKRLTHGMDYKARLCGVDAEVADKPFLFWCRADPRDIGEWPTSLNLENPSCVETCPTFNASVQIPCLFHQATQSLTLSGGQFGNVETYHVQSQQNIAYTTGYKTTPLGGRFCIPDNTKLKGEIMGPFGPMNAVVRARNAVGSFQDPWGVLFLCSLLAVVVGYAYVFLIKECGKWVIYSFLGISYALFLLGTLFFGFGVVGLLEGSSPGLEATMRFAEYKGLNPLFARMPTFEASIGSVVVASVMGCVSCGILGTFSHLGGPSGFHYIHDLIDASAEVFMAMRSMMLPPIVQALMKYMLMWILSYNFMYLVSVGKFNDRRIEVNGEFYRGADARYSFDWWITPWIVYYLYGWVWIMEIINAMGHFQISFSVISWYFMKKDGLRKTGVPNLPLWKGTEAMLAYHMGSICLGAAIVPWFRLVRLFNWIEDEAVPAADGECGEGCTALNAICKCLGGVGSRCTAARKSCCMPACCKLDAEPRSAASWTPAGASYRFSKNAYNDVIIRSQHFIEASSRSFLLISKYTSCKQYILEGKGCQIVTVVGATSIGIICTLFCYLLLMQIPGLEDPSSSSYISDPLAVCFLCFLLCGPCIGYGFMMLFDHTADTLLYCYAWNKKFNKDNDGAPVDDYLPESLRDIIDEDYDKDEAYSYYGNARPEMYLSTWLPSRRKDNKDKKFSDKERAYNTTGMGASGSQRLGGGTSGSGAGPMYTNAPYDTAGAYPGPPGGYPMQSQGFGQDYGGHSPGGYGAGYGSPAAGGYGGYNGSG